MTDKLKKLLESAQHWSEERQEDAAELLALIEEHDKSPYRLTPEQTAEVRKRLADTDAKMLTLSKLDERLRLLGV